MQQNAEQESFYADCIFYVNLGIVTSILLNHPRFWKPFSEAHMTLVSLLKESLVTFGRNTEKIILPLKVISALEISKTQFI